MLNTMNFPFQDVMRAPQTIKFTARLGFSHPAYIQVEVALTAADN